MNLIWMKKKSAPENGFAFIMQISKRDESLWRINVQQNDDDNLFYLKHANFCHTNFSL